MNEPTRLHRILELARWAPSGDNTQPWRFEILGPDHIAVHGSDTRDWCLYDFRGHASHMAHGALLETLRIAATGSGLSASWSPRDGTQDHAPVYDVKLAPDSTEADPLLPHIEARTVQRRPMRGPRLTAAQREVLVAAVGDAYTLQIFDTGADKRRIARLLWDNAYIRLTCPEAYPVHRDIIEWGAQFSEDRIPERAVGVDPMTGRLMRWVLGDWRRVDFFNRYLGGTIAPRVQLDVVPALACSAHVLLRPRHAPDGWLDHVAAGVAMQRLWLTAQSVGLHLQPEMTPVIFRWYARAGDVFTADAPLSARAEALATRFEAIANAAPGDPFAFFCRLGVSARPASRSTRLPLSALLIDPQDRPGDEPR
ncbi:MAG: nitroreductase family protein [Rhodocyclaceae bacterium]|nr:nitroreductase family protein [Rhodocyclaceae bacterium]